MEDMFKNMTRQFTAQEWQAIRRSRSNDIMLKQFYRYWVIFSPPLENAVHQIDQKYQYLQCFDTKKKCYPVKCSETYLETLFDIKDPCLKAINL